MPFLVYSLLRLGLLAAALVALWLVGMRDWLLVLVATVVAWALSYLMLNRHRAAAALWLAGRAEARRTSGRRISADVDADAAAEDAEAELAGSPTGRPSQPDDTPPSHGQTEAEQQAVAELEGAGAGEDGPEQDPAGAEQDGAGEQPGRDREQQHQQ